MYFWLCCNAAYALGTSMLIDSNISTVANDGSIGFLAGFSIFVALLMVSRFLFAALYIIKWNLRMCLCSHYKKSKISAEAAFRKIKGKETGNAGSDEEDDEDDEDQNDNS